MDQNVVHSVTIKTEPETEEKNITLVDFPFICRICLGRGELRLFQEEQCLWVLFLNLTKIDVHSTVDFPKNICMECITKLEDISSFIDIARNTDLDFVKNVSFIKVEDQMLPNPEKVGEYNNESTRYCCACFSPSNLSSFKEKTTLLQLFQEITMIDVGGNTNIWHKTSICSQCTNELRKVSHFKNLSITNSRFLERLAITNTKKELLSTNGDENLESVTGRYVLKVECTVKFTASDIREGTSEEGSESNTETKVTEPLPTSIDIKQEIIDSDTEASMDQTIDKHSSKDVFKETEEKPFRCEYCGKNFSRKYNMESHSLTHSGEKPFKCDYCDKHFTIKSNLKRHSLTHTGETPMKCHYCHKGFTQKSYLNTHLLTHTGEKPFKCDHCDKHFNLNCNLKRHFLTHTGEKPFKCCHCGKAFALKQNLNSHSLTHNHSPTQTGEKFKCDLCDKYFNYKCFLKRHLLTHTGEKPFECCRCGKGFALKHHLNSHRISHNHLPTQT